MRRGDRRGSSASSSSSATRPSRAGTFSTAPPTSRTAEWAGSRPQDKPEENEITRLYFRELADKGRQYFAGDVDGVEGIDTIGFANGWGDGAFPSIAGYDASGRRVEIVLWTKAVPWRLAFPDGRPPRTVTKAENQLARCLKGKERMYGSRCRVAR